MFYKNIAICDYISFYTLPSLCAEISKPRDRAHSRNLIDHAKSKSNSSVVDTSFKV